MSTRVLFILILLLSSSIAWSQQDVGNSATGADSTKNDVISPSDGSTLQGSQSQFYYGGYVGASFGDYSTFTAAPLIGYHVSPVVSAGVRLNYEYISDKRYEQTFHASNYGGSVFALARVHPKAYLQAEFQYMSYEYRISATGSDRTWVPFLYLGGGFVQPIGGNVSFVLSAMVDVLQDKNSPYEDWSPMFSVGVIAGF